MPAQLVRLQSVTSWPFLIHLNEVQIHNFRSRIVDRHCQMKQKTEYVKRCFMTLMFVCFDFPWEAFSNTSFFFWQLGLYKA